MGECSGKALLCRGDAFALRGVEVPLDGATGAFCGELGAFLDAVLARQLFVTEANVRTNLRAGVAGGAFAEVEVGIGGFTVGDIATARAVDGLCSVAFRVGSALATHLDLYGRVGTGHAAGFVFFLGEFVAGLERRVCGLASTRGVTVGFTLTERTADATLEVIDEADARLALEGTRLDVFLGHFEAGEVRVVFVLGDARVADPAALTGKGHSAHCQNADQTKHAGQDRTGHQIVLLEAGGAPLQCAERASMTRRHALLARTQPTRPALRR